MRNAFIRVASILVGLSLVSAILTVPTRAEDIFESTRKGFQFGPAPGSVCNNFLITEMTVLYRVKRADSKPTMYDLRPSTSTSYMFNWQIGYMGNTSAHDSWGAAFNIGLGDDRYRLGFGPTYRRWFRHRSFFDASVGVLFAGEEDGFNVQGLPLFAQVGLGVSSVFSIVGRIEHINFKDILYYGPDVFAPSNWSATFYHLGISVGGEPGAVLCGVSAIAFVVIVVALNSEKTTTPVTY